MMGRAARAKPRLLSYPVVMVGPMKQERCPECGEPYTGDLDNHLDSDCTNYDDDEDQEAEEGEC